jgi:hypothetical protein
MSSHNKGLPIAPGFCAMHLKYLMSCSDAAIEAALPELPAYDLNRLRRLLNTPLKGVAAPEQKEAG